MSNYTQGTFFAPKDALLTGNPSKLIRGADVDPELLAIAVAIATKYDAANISSTPVGFNDGAVGAPGITFAADTDTGLYRVGPNELAIALAGLQTADFAPAGTTLFGNGGVALTARGVNNSNAALITGGAASGQSFGLQLNAGTTVADYAIRAKNAAAADVFVVRGDSAVLAADDGGSLQTVGWRDAPLNVQNAYTTVLSDRGKTIQATTNGTTLTIAANASVAYPLGTVLMFSNQSAGNISIAIGGTDTLKLAGTATTGTRTLASNGIASAIKTSATQWVISGAGLS